MFISKLFTAILLLIIGFSPPRAEAFCKSSLSGGGGEGERRRPPQVQIDLELAVDNRNLLEITKLLEAGADIDGIGLWWTPLARAAQINRVEIAQYLLEVGADPNATDIHGRYPLEWAVQKGDLDMAGLLLDRGADLELRLRIFNVGGTLLETAIGIGFDRVTIKDGPLHNWRYEHLRSSFRAQNGMVHLLFERGFQIPQDRVDQTLLAAVQDGSPEVLRKVISEIDFGPGHFERFNATHGFSPLHFAIMEGQKRDPEILLQVVRILVEAGHGLDLKAEKMGRRTPLEAAEYQRSPSRVITYLSR